MRTTMLGRSAVTVLIAIFSLHLVASRVYALDPEEQSKVDSKVVEIASWGKSPELIAALNELAAAPSDTIKSMNQKDWEALTVLDPKVREFTTNKVGAFLKGKKAKWLTEAFVSFTSGIKAGFLKKPSNWSHAGHAKHEKPIAGEKWQGEAELDLSTGKEQLQVSVPVVDGDKVVGSLVIGLDLGAI